MLQFSQGVSSLLDCTLAAVEEHLDVASATNYLESLLVQRSQGVGDPSVMHVVDQRQPVSR